VTLLLLILPACAVSHQQFCVDFVILLPPVVGSSSTSKQRDFSYRVYLLVHFPALSLTAASW
jgi:hypothetical protein